jgi:RNA polymerase sigma-32 factor
LKPTNLPPATGSLAMYLSEIRQYPLLTKDEEQALARRYREQEDARCAHSLVTSNLRFVVKVAYEYRSYGLRMADLIQEGNIGLMKGVQKFNPDKGIRLISYAVWWIRAYIQNHILRNWSLVKLGTTQAQRKLFFSLARTKREIERMSGDEAPDARQIAKRLRVRPTEVQEMERRIDGRDLSLDSPMGDETGSSHVDFVPATAPGQEEEFAARQEEALIRDRVRNALEGLDPRERFIIEMRLLSDKPMTLRQLGQHFGFSRERARQLEIRAKERLKASLAELADGLWNDGQPRRGAVAEEAPVEAEGTWA